MSRKTQYACVLLIGVLCWAWSYYHARQVSHHRLGYSGTLTDDGGGLGALPD